MTRGKGITACIVCQDNAKTIERCLQSLAFCDEIVVVDGFSTDGTYDIANRYATVIEQRKFDTLMAQRTRCYELAKGEWIFWMDSDEEATEELASEIRDTLAGGGNLPDGFRISRRWHYPTSWGSDGSFSREYVHLFRKSSAWFGPPGTFHITPQPNDLSTWRTGSLRGVIEHWPWDEMDQVISRGYRYAMADAEVQAGTGRTSGPLRTLIHGVARFLRYYFVKGGFLRGAPGFFLSLAMANEAFVKYSRIWEVNQQRKSAANDASAQARDGEE